jgi:hypothetical protein
MVRQAAIMETCGFESLVLHRFRGQMLWNVGISHECERSEMAFRRILESASTE